MINSFQHNFFIHKSQLRLKILKYLIKIHKLLSPMSLFIDLFCFLYTNGRDILLLLLILRSSHLLILDEMRFRFNTLS